MDNDNKKKKERTSTLLSTQNVHSQSQPYF